MAIGQQILQLAQGIIANERQRKQLELQREQFDFQRKQAEQALSTELRTLRAKEEFNQIQQMFAELKLKEARDPEMKALEIRERQARIAVDESVAAKNRTSANKPRDDISPADTFKQRAVIDSHVRDLRVAEVLDTVDRGVQSPEAQALNQRYGIDLATIDTGMITAKRRTREGIQQEAENLAKQRENILRQYAGLGALPANVQKEVNDLRYNQQTIEAALNELTKAETQTITRQEFVFAASQVSGLNADDAMALYDNVQRAGALREDIMGTVGVSRPELNAALRDAQVGRPDGIIAMIRRGQGGLLNDKGVFLNKEEGKMIVAKWLYAEGILDEEVNKSVIRAFMPFSPPRISKRFPSSSRMSSIIIPSYRLTTG